MYKNMLIHITRPSSFRSNFNGPHPIGEQRRGTGFILCHLIIRRKALFQHDFGYDQVAQKSPKSCHFVPLFTPRWSHEFVFFTLLFVKKVKKEPASDGRPWSMPLE
jgi:hypothetical protein